MARAHPNRIAYGTAILSRLKDAGVPSSLQDDYKAFNAQHGAFATAMKAVEKAEETYDTKAKNVGPLDRKRDITVLGIADKLPGAGLGSRASPFEQFSKFAPSKLVTLPYAAETAELRSLFPAILKAQPPAEIAKLCERGTKENEAVDSGLKALSAPLAALNEARAKRDAIVPDWEKALRHLKDAAKVAFRDIQGRFDAIFAEPQAVQTQLRPKKRPRKVAPAVTGEGNSQSAETAKRAPKRRSRRR